MISLRKLVDGFRNMDASLMQKKIVCCATSYAVCAQQLSAELTKYERLIEAAKVVGPLLMKRYGTDEELNAVYELGEALKELEQ